ncbi:MAG: polyphosphate kinase 1, partial [Planctomycetota bacterium]|nr:polyphosphate kinase 1 [Planctomycetota bacterium]
MTTAPQRSSTEPIASPSEIPGDVKMLNRELSWLEFNRRVLRLATDERTPLLERVKFLAIFSSNLDEFVQKRVGGLKRQVEAGVSFRPPDGMGPKEQLEAIRAMILDLQTEQATCYEQQIIPALARDGIELVRYVDLEEEERAFADRWFRTQVFPLMTPLAVDPGHRFPFISNLSTSMGVTLTQPDHSEQLFARVKIPSSIPRWIRVQEATSDYRVRLVNLPDLVRYNLDDLFPGMVIQDVMAFRVTRSAELERDDEDIEDLMESIEEELRQRRFAPAVRLEVWPDSSPSILELVLEDLDLTASDVYKRPGPLDYSGLMAVADLNRPELKDQSWTPVTPPRLTDSETDIFSVIRQGDLLVHHPYEGFASSVERFISAAARDPKVLAIKQTLYRTSAESPFVRDLKRAAESGKQVACLVELRARFDEFANIQVAQQLEKAGVHVAYGVIGFKTHTKTALVVRQDSDGLRCYAHIGTGNYNS